LQHDIPNVFADIGLIERALDNLIDNALRHTSKGASVRVRLAETAGRIELRVEDEGHGIPSSDLPRLFERFHQGARSDEVDGGTGFGLAITRRIVDLHGGTLAVQSEVDVGSTFCIEIDVHDRGTSPVDSKSDIVVTST